MFVRQQQGPGRARAFWVDTRTWPLGSPAAAAVLCPRSRVWLPGMTWRSRFSGDGGRCWARLARSALRYCSRVTWRTERISEQVKRLLMPPPLAHKHLNQVGESHWQDEGKEEPQAS